MFNGGMIITTAIVSRIMLKRKVLRHQVLACFFSTIGFIVVGISAISSGASSDSMYSFSGIMVGIVLTLISLVIVAVQANIEELILT